MQINVGTGLQHVKTDKGKWKLNHVQFSGKQHPVTNVIKN